MVKHVVASATTSHGGMGSACGGRGKWPQGLTCDFSAGAKSVRCSMGGLRSVAWREGGEHELRNVVFLVCDASRGAW